MEISTNNSVINIISISFTEAAAMTLLTQIAAVRERLIEQLDANTYFGGSAVNKCYHDQGVDNLFLQIRDLLEAVPEEGMVSRVAEAIKTADCLAAHWHNSEYTSDKVFPYLARAAITEIMKGRG